MIQATSKLAFDEILKAQREQELAEAARKAEREARESGDNGFSKKKDAESMTWEQGDENICVRIIGAPATSPTRSQPYDGIHTIVSKVYDDDGKFFVFRRNPPNPKEDAAHQDFMTRLIADIYRKKWDENAVNPKDPTKKGYSMEVNVNMPWWSNVTHGGSQPGSKSYQYSKGWKGQEVTVLNVIDRHDNWCKEHKHTKLLCKSISEKTQEDGSISRFAETGIPSYGFDEAFTTLFTQYGSWSDYDVIINRHSFLDKNQTKVSWNVTNASRVKNMAIKAGEYIEGSGAIIPELGNKTSEVVVGPLSEEELAYDAYDLTTYEAPTRYGLILSHLGRTIQAISNDLHKDYYGELCILAKKEEEEWKVAHAAWLAEHTNNSNAEAPKSDIVEEPVAAETAPVTETAPAAAPVREAVQPAASSMSGSPAWAGLIKGWAKLDSNERALITGVTTHPDGTLDEIKFSVAPNELCACPEQSCLRDSPSSYRTCPYCGSEFQLN